MKADKYQHKTQTRHSGDEDEAEDENEPTVWCGDELEVCVVLLDKPLDEVDLLERDLHRVLVLGTTGGVGHPQLKSNIS